MVRIETFDLFITFGAILLLGSFLVFSVLSSVSSISKTVFVGLEKNRLETDTIGNVFFTRVNGMVTF